MTRSTLAAVAIAAAVSIGGFVAIVAVGDDSAIPNTTISAGQFKDASYYNRIDRAGGGISEFVITRNGVPTAFVGDLDDPPTTTTTSTTSTTTTPPPTGGYPSITTVDFDGDFDSGCQLVGGQGGWVNQYNTSTSSQIVHGNAGEGECWAKLTSSGSGGGTRAEFGSGTLPATTEVAYEFLVFLPSGTPHTGYIAQNKMEENQGSCANGGVSMPQDLGGRVVVRVRSDCDADHRDLDLGPPPRDQWFAVWVQARYSDSNGYSRARLDPDGPGPLPYGAELSLTGDTSSGGNVKHRLGAYGSMPSGNYVGVDGYHRDCLSTC